MLLGVSDLSAQSVYHKEEETQNVLGGDTASGPLRLLSLQVLTVTEFRSTLGPTYLRPLYVLFSQKFKKKNSSSRDIEMLRFLKIFQHVFNIIIFNKIVFLH